MMNRILQFQCGLIGTVLSLSCGNSFSQQSKIAIKFDDHTAGKYQGERLTQDWPKIKWSHTERVSVVSGTDSLRGKDGKCLRITYPKGKIGSDESGGIFRVHLEPSEEYYLDYQVRFGHGNGDHWDFSRGGKLPGLGGGECNTGGNRSTGDGWSTRYMWRDGGRMIAYIYHVDQKTRYGDQVPLEFTVKAGQWYRFTQRVRINSEGKRDGILQVWVDGKLVLDRKDFRFRTGTKAPINYFLFSTFFGGSKASWAPNQESLAYFDEIRIQPTAENLNLDQ